MAAAQHILCEYQQAEEKGVGLLRQLKTFAPTEEVAEEIAEQVEDELRHTRLFAERLKDLDIDCETLMEALAGIYDLAQECVDKKDWVRSIAIQTVIEELAMATFTNQLGKQDEETESVLREIIVDEQRHLEFGMRELNKVRQGNEEQIRDIHLKVGKIFILAFAENRLPQSIRNTAKKAHKMHQQRLRKIGVEVPGIADLA
ncbi:MAG: ferritin-like domain-containing protein [bacterium]|nr:ferritin-like domain-containing protein [bacterium]